MQTQRLLNVLVFVTLVLAGGVLAQIPQLLAHSGPNIDRAEGMAQYDIQVLGQIGGTASAVAAQGDYAYAAIGWRLVTLDISESAQPKAVGDSVLTHTAIDVLTIEENYLYALAGGSLLVYDISEPTTPLLAGYYPSGGHNLQVVGNRAFIASGQGLQILDVSDLAHIVHLGDCSPGEAFDVAVSGSYAFVAGGGTSGTGGTKLWVIDIADPAAPHFVNQVSISSINAIEIMGEYALLSADGLKILDISDPLAVEVVGQVDAPILGVTVHGGIAYANEDSYSSPKLYAIDVSDVTAPTVIGTMPLPDSEWWNRGRRPSMTLVASQSGVSALLPMMELGLQVIDVGAPANMQIIGAYSEFVDARDVAVANGYSYVLDQAADLLRIYQTVNPARPVEVGTYPLAGKHIVVQGDNAYVGGDSLRILDVSDPAAPVEVGSLDGPTADFDVAGQYAYLGGDTLRIVDVSNPAAPQVVGSGDWDVRVVRVDGDYAYTIGRIIDVSNPELPIEAAEYSLPFKNKYSDHLDVADGYLYVTGVYAYPPAPGPLGSILDVSDPENPLLLGSDDMLGGLRIAVAGGMAYISGEGRSRYQKSFNMIDVLDSESPHKVAALDLPAHCPFCYGPFGLPDNVDLFADDAEVYVADGHGGLFILRPLPITTTVWWWEAEDGSVTPPLAVHPDQSACADQYVSSDVGWAGGDLEFTIDVASGNYFLWARAMGLGWDQNSFWASVDGGDAFHFEIPQNGGVWDWGWAQVHPELQPILPIGLTAGNHTLRFEVREANARLDAVYLTNRPDLRPDDAAYCQPPATPTPTPTPTRPPNTPTPTPTPANTGLTQVGQLGGVVAAMDAQADLIYLGQGPRLVIMDATDPEMLVPLGQSSILPDLVEAVVVGGGFAYVVADGLRVVDVSDPANPTLRGHLPGVRGELQLVGEHLYAAESDHYPDESHVYAIDVSQPDAPAFVGTYTLPGLDVFVAEPYIYTIEGIILHIFEISDFGSPPEVGSYEMDLPEFSSGGFKSVQVEDGTAFLTTDIRSGVPQSSHHRISVLDVSDPAQPILLGSHEWSESGDSLGEIVVKQGYAFVERIGGWKDVPCSLYSFDVSDPTAIVQGDTIRYTGCSPLRIDGDRLVIGLDQIDILDVSKPMRPERLARHRPLGSDFTAIEANEEALYLKRSFGSYGMGDLVVVSIANPTQPAFVERIGAVTVMHAQGALLYSFVEWWDDWSGNYLGNDLSVYDVSVPLAPQLIEKLWVDDGYGYPSLSANESTLFLGLGGTIMPFDVRDLDNIQRLPHYEGEGVRYGDVFAVESKLYVREETTLNGDSSLIILDVSDPADPHETGRYRNWIGELRVFYVQNEMAFLALSVPCCNDSPRPVLQLVDCSEPANPTLVAETDLPVQGVRDLHVDGDFVYLLDEQRVWVLDVSDLTTPKLVGVYRTAGEARAIDSRGDLVYVADGPGGLLVLHNDLAPTPTPSPNLLYLPLVEKSM